MLSGVKEQQMNMEEDQAYGKLLLGNIQVSLSLSPHLIL